MLPLKTIQAVDRREDAELWAITCFFDPAGFRTRLRNYRVFREHLRLPLVTVELGYGAEFQLANDDAEILIQLRAEDVLWQRERMLGIALRAVPPACCKIVWLDCDLLFEKDDWPDRVTRLLDKVQLVQPFREVCEVRPDARKGESGWSHIGSPSSTFARNVSKEADAFGSFAAGAEQQARFGTGLGWAFNRALFESHEFYSAGVVGGNDLAMACAAFGRFEVAYCNWHMNPRQKEHYHAWAEQYFEDVRGDIGSLDQRVFHLWHGRIVDRRYRRRHEGLMRFKFDPFNDIATDVNGCWRWSSDKPELHSYVRSWFVGRREDTV